MFCNLDANNNPMSARKLTDEQVQEVCKKYKLLYSMNDIAKDYPVSRSTISNYLNREGVKKRGKFERMNTFRFLTKQSSNNASNWQGGLTKIEKTIRSSAKNKKFRADVLGRDNHTCVICDTSPKKDPCVVLNVDHIIPLNYLIAKHKIKTKQDAENCNALFDMNNGRTLCLSCHKETSSYSPIKQISLLDENKNVIYRFNSIREASIKMKISCSSIVGVCKGNRKSTRSMRFQYSVCDKEEPALNTYEQLDQYLYLNNLCHYTPGKERQIKLVDNNKNTIKIYSSAKSASQALNLDPSALTKVCKGKLKSTGNKIFRYLHPRPGEPGYKDNIKELNSNTQLKLAL